MIIVQSDYRYCIFFNVLFLIQHDTIQTEKNYELSLVHLPKLLTLTSTIM